jgi:UPF0755 protein
MRTIRRLLIGLAAVVLVLFGVFLYGWYGAGPLAKDAAFVVPSGATLSSAAGKLEQIGAISSSRRFLLQAKVLGGSEPIKAGEFLIPAHSSANRVLELLQGTDVIRRVVTIPEGMPSIEVYERLMSTPYLTGKIPVPAEGSVLPDTYDYTRGEARASVLLRMQAAMKLELASAWDKRSPDTVAKTPREALILASIVEKETGKPSERAMVAGLYSNRLRKGMLLQADPTIIYPITKGKPLGRRIKQSEIAAVNDYNTYTMVGLPKGPITNPGRASIEAVLHPAKTDALYMVADGTGGHMFADTLEQHNANVARWFALRKARGDM